MVNRNQIHNNVATKSNKLSSESLVPNSETSSVATQKKTAHVNQLVLVSHRSAVIAVVELGIMLATVNQFHQNYGVKHLANPLPALPVLQLLNRKAATLRRFTKEQPEELSLA